jgi:predicted Zn-dependent peptidase
MSGYYVTWWSSKIKDIPFWFFHGAKDDNDYRNDIYQQVPKMTMDDLQRFFDEYIKDKKYTILVLGDDFNVLQQFGKLKTSVWKRCLDIN